MRELYSQVCTKLMHVTATKGEIQAAGHKYIWRTSQMKANKSMRYVCCR